MLTKIFAFCMVLLAIDLPDVNKIAKINKLKEEAALAYKQKMYNVAINRYQTLVKDLGVEDEKIKLNLAHSYYLSQDMSNATKTYGGLVLATDKYIRSVAHQQLGNIRAKEGDFETAMVHYKEALKADPTNEAVRQNYEVAKKQQEKKQQQQKQNPENQDNKDKQKEEKEKDKQQQQKDQQQKEQQQKEQQEKEQQEKEKQQQQQKEQEQKQKEQQKQKEGASGEKKDSQGDKKQAERDDNSDKTAQEKEKEKSQLRSQRLQNINMTEEQAKNILDAMKSSEVQYLQQNQKRTNKKPEKGKPDW